MNNQDQLVKIAQDFMTKINEVADNYNQVFRDYHKVVYGKDIEAKKETLNKLSILLNELAPFINFIKQSKARAKIINTHAKFLNTEIQALNALNRMPEKSHGTVPPDAEYLHDGITKIMDKMGLKGTEIEKMFHIIIDKG